MEGKVWGLLAAFLFIVCFAGYISYAEKLDSRHSELRELSYKLDAVQQGLDARLALIETTRKRISELQEVADLFNKEADEVNELNKKKQLANKKITELTESRKKTLKEFGDLIQKVRTRSIGMEFATLQLNNGQRLHAVKIQNVTDTSISLTHSHGLIKIEGKELPKDLRARFRYEMEPVISRVEEAPPTLPPAPAAMPEPPATLPQPSQTLASMAQNSLKASHYQIEISGIDQKIIQLQNSQNDWSRAAAAYRSQAATAQFSGRPSYTFRAQAAQADQNIQTLNAQIAKLREDQMELRKKMATAMAPE